MRPQTDPDREVDKLMTKGVNADQLGNMVVRGSLSDHKEVDARVNRVLEAAGELGRALRLYMDQRGGLVDEMRKLDTELGAATKTLAPCVDLAARDIRSLLTMLRDVRRFFLEADHATEVTRLREFVDLVERLERLKKDGFLDAVADTMLRLSEKKS